MQIFELLFSFLTNQSQQHHVGFGLVSIDKIALQKKFWMEPSIILGNQELAVWNNLQVPKRKIEWLSGRLAAKQALLYYRQVPFSFPSMEIAYGEHRAPYFLAYPHLYLSISHSHEFAIAVVADFRIGIDLEKIFSPEASLLQYFFSSAENKYLESFSGLEYSQKATMIWTHKEAISKLLQLGGNLHFKELDTTQVSNYVISQCWAEEYCLSLAMEKVRNE